MRVLAVELVDEKRLIILFADMTGLYILDD